MYRDIAEIRQFYQTALGRLTVATLERAFKHHWPEWSDNHTTSLLGVGYALPYLDEQGSAIAVMPATQGVIRWPAKGANRTVVTEDHLLPFVENAIDRILFVHAIENAEYLRELLHDAWRVLAPNGRMFLIVPNRRGVWARSDKTPFGQGRPYSMKQMRQLLRETDFVIEQHQRALYFFPSHNRVLRWLTPVFEAVLSRLMPKFGGVLMIEASKRLYSVTAIPVTSQRHSPAPVWASAEPMPT
jgi:SAM-dependent methyltransferase